VIDSTVVSFWHFFAFARTLLHLNDVMFRFAWVNILTSIDGNFSFWTFGIQGDERVSEQFQ
jgi:hypothetical protein